MSKEGLPAIAQVDARGLRVAVVTATWNEEVCDQLHQQAVDTARANGQPRGSSMPSLPWAASSVAVLRTLITSAIPSPKPSRASPWMNRRRLAMGY